MEKFTDIQIIHRAYEDLDEIGRVANVRVYSDTDVESNLEYAYRITQNVHGSWSRDKYMPSGDLNGDYNPWIKEIKPLKVDKNSKEWGHRSTSEGDLLVLDGTTYKVAGFGFQEVNHDEWIKKDRNDNEDIISRFFTS